MAENVKGLLSHDNGRTLNTIISVFEDLGYTIGNRKQILNACYYGVGQKRERIVIIGIRNDIHTEFHYPEAEKKQTTLREALNNCPLSSGISYSEKNARYLNWCLLVAAGLIFLRMLQKSTWGNHTTLVAVVVVWLEEYLGMNHALPLLAVHPKSKLIDVIQTRQDHLQ